MDLREPGTLLEGKYEIVERLGSGGMGEVHVARHVHLHELRVIKILRQDLAADPAARARFTREARLATQIKHPNVAILYDFSTLPSGSFYMVWEYIKGEHIGDRLRSKGPLPVPLAIDLGIQALRGLYAIHSAGIIHRDLSPDNLMIAEDRGGQLRVKIIDLGLARSLGSDVVSDATDIGMFLGKLQYCSPEQAEITAGAALDHRTDIYSFALVLYEMISGRTPFESENQAGFIFKRLSEDPLPLLGRNPQVEVPPELDRVIRRALERDRNRRFADALSFIVELEKVAKGIAAVETREIPMLAEVARQVSPPGSVPAPPQPASRSELSRAEKLDLLAQIDRAGKRTQELAPQLSRLESALSAGRLDEARSLLAEIEAVNPRAAGLTTLKARLRPLEERAESTRRVAETERVLSGYLQKKQAALARLALDTLLELAPEHPRKAELADALAQLTLGADRDKRVQAAIAAGRDALAKGDFKAARRELDAVVKLDPKGHSADAFRREIDAAEHQARQGSERESHVHRLEAALAAGRADEAERELAALTALGLSRVTADSYRERLDEVRASLANAEKLEYLERCFKDAIREHGWLTAREVASELERTIPLHPRAAAMFAEIDRLESLEGKQRALEQGVRQVETFIAQGDAAKAQLALKILLQMDPENRNRKRLEKALQGLAAR